MDDSWDELGKVEDLKDDKALGDAMKSKSPTVIFLYMAECHHCKTMWPIIKKLANEKDDVKFKRIQSNNVGTHKPSDLEGFPHYIMVGKGSMKSFGGSMSAEELKGKLFGTDRLGSSRNVRRVGKSRHGSARRKKTLRRKLSATRKGRR